MKKVLFYFCFIFPLLIQEASADRFNQTWGALPGANEYEYEISNDPKFPDDALVRQGKTKKTSLSGSLRPGVFFLRIRGIDAQKRPGRWSQPLRFLIQGATPDIQQPKDKDTVEIVSKESSIYIQWRAVEGADDYELNLTPLKGGKGFRVVTLDTSASRKGLAAGGWRVSVRARIRGQTFSSSKSVTFNVIENELAHPTILEPFNARILAPWRPFTVDWLRKIPGKRSEVIVYKMGRNGGVVDVIKEKRLSKATIRGLPPGNYQITVRDYLNESEEFGAETIQVKLNADYFDGIGNRMGANLRFLGSITSGWHSAGNYSMGETGEAYAATFEPGIDTRFAGLMGQNIVYETSFHYRTTEYESTQRKIRTRHIGMRLGGGYSFFPMGPSNPLNVKGLLWGRQIESPIQESGQATNFRLFGFGGAAEWIFASWRSMWQIHSEFKVDFPIWVSGNSLGTGKTNMIPSLALEAFLVRQLTGASRINFGVFGELEKFGSSEDRYSRDTTMTRAQYGAKLGLQFEL